MRQISRNAIQKNVAFYGFITFFILLAVKVNPWLTAAVGLGSFLLEHFRPITDDEIRSHWSKEDG